jgi:hypothetical protein
MHNIVFPQHSENGVGANAFHINGRFSFAATSQGQTIPFYLMPTLGGANLGNEETMRGFVDYRFRDRDYALLQVDYTRRIYGPIDFLTFYDTGKVAPSLSQFGTGRLRHTAGAGVVVALRKDKTYLLRLYFAFGSGEGMRTYIGPGDMPRNRDRLLR